MSAFFGKRLVNRIEDTNPIFIMVEASTPPSFAPLDLGPWGTGLAGALADSRLTDLVQA